MARDNMSNLEVTGLVMELPRAKEPTRAIERKILTPILSSSPKTPPNRSVSQMVVKKQSNSASKSLTPSDTAVKDLKIRNYEDEIKRLKKNVEELEQQSKTSQKTNKEKDKIIDELNKKLKNSSLQEQEYTEKLAEMENLRATNESLNKKLKENEDLIKTMTTQANEESSKLKEDHLNELTQLRDEHMKELKNKDEKLDLLKKQIAGAFKDNSWERQTQIDELTRELKRTQEEYELIKMKLKQLKNTNTKNLLS